MIRNQKEIYELVKLATVAICRIYPGGRVIPFGSGINVDPSGVVVTCKHVIEAAQVQLNPDGSAPQFQPSEEGVKSDTVKMYDIAAVFSFIDNHKLELGIARFEIIHGPHSSDLAVCRLRGEAPLPAAKLGNSDEVFEGQSIFTCGFPLGSDLQPEFPVGALFNRGVIAGIRPHYSVTPRKEFLLDISINAGNSGGPLCSDKTGEIIGVINAQVLRKNIPTGIGCAVPSRLVEPLISTVLAITDEQLKEMDLGKWPLDR